MNRKLIFILGVIAVLVGIGLWFVRNSFGYQYYACENSISYKYPIGVADGGTTYFRNGEFVGGCSFWEGKCEIQSEAGQCTKSYWSLF